MRRCRGVCVDTGRRAGRLPGRPRAGRPEAGASGRGVRPSGREVGAAHLPRQQGRRRGARGHAGRCGGRCWAWLVQRGAGRGVWSIAATATATWISLGGTSLARTGLEMSELLERGDVEAARRLLPSLCGRDPARLDGAGLTRAALESVAENTSDAQVAPLLWAAAGGVPAVLAIAGSTRWIR